MKTVDINHLENHLRERRAIIDVRAPGEFLLGSIPNSINIPLLDDEERHQILV